MILSYLHSPFLLHFESPRSGSQRVFQVYDHRVQGVLRMFLRLSDRLAQARVGVHCTMFESA
jgi:hypothetical protein